MEFKIHFEVTDENKITVYKHQNVGGKILFKDDFSQSFGNYTSSEDNKEIEGTFMENEDT